jgi:hypothetical protein
VNERFFVRGQLTGEIPAGYVRSGNGKIEAQARAGRRNECRVNVLFDFGAQAGAGRGSMPPSHAIQRDGIGFYLPVVSGQTLAGFG